MTFSQMDNAKQSGEIAFSNKAKVSTFRGDRKQLLVCITFVINVTYVKRRIYLRYALC